MTSERVRTLEFLRFFFMVILLSWHGQYGFFTKGYLVVEFFFIVSGYFLMDSYLRNPKLSAFQFTINRVKKTYFEYILAAIISFLYYGILVSVINKSFKVEAFYKFISEAFILQNVGIFSGGFNYPLWYYCVLIVGGYFLYYIIAKFKSGIQFIIPLFCLMSFVLLSNISENKLENWQTLGCIYIPIIRGASEIGVGILLRSIVENNFCKKYNSKALDLLFVLSFILTIGIMVNENVSDFYILLTFPVLIFSALRNECVVSKMFQSKIWDKLGKITWEMFLLHGVLISITNKALSIAGIEKGVFVFIIVVIIVTGLSFVFRYLCKCMREFMETKWLLKNNLGL